MPRAPQILGLLATVLVAALFSAAQAIERRIPTADGERTYLHSPTGLDSPSGPRENPAPVLVFLHGNDLSRIDTLQHYYRQWEPVARKQKWHIVLPWSEGKYSFTSDSGVQAIREMLRDFSKRASVDRTRVFLVGHGDSAPAVFYALSRIPQQWAAGLAIGGDAGKAIESNRLFGGNAAAIPILWVYEEERLRLLQQTISRLKSAGLQLNLQVASEFSVAEAAEWLAPHSREKVPSTIDYESGSPDFAESYWISIKEFDFSLRNDALDSTRVDPGTGAFLRLGGFGYDPGGTGPGLTVKWLPEKYKGPLKLEDCIVSVGGTMIEDARHYAEFMESQRESRDVGIIVLREGKSERLETRIVIPKRDETETARVHAEYLSESQELMLVSRGVRALEVDVPAAWGPVKLNWNGLDMLDGAERGCWRLLDSDPAGTKPCPVEGEPASHSGKTRKAAANPGLR